MSAIFKKLKITPDVSIYIKRTNFNGSIWYNEQELGCWVPHDEIISKENEELKKIFGSQFEELTTSTEILTDEIIKYHFEFESHETANIVFENEVKSDYKDINSIL